MISIRKIDEKNEKRVREVSIRTNQQAYIETVDECLREASECENWRPVAIYSGDTIVGFAMYGSFGENRYTWIDRIMIDKKYQGQGFGKEAMIQLISKVAQEYNVNILYLSIVEGNTVACKLYKELGFEYLEKDASNGEYIFEYKVK